MLLLMMIYGEKMVNLQSCGNQLFRARRRVDIEEERAQPLPVNKAFGVGVDVVVISEIHSLPHALVRLLYEKFT